MMRRGYSKRHYDLVANTGTGNPALSPGQKREAYLEMARKLESEGHFEAAEVARKLADELQEAS